MAAVTGLLLDPYFSATKIAWVLDHVDGARARAERGELLCGTMDAWVTWRLTGGAVHATDATNASRTLLFDLERQDWSPRMAALFGVPMALLPQVKDTADDYGETLAEILGRPVPIRALVGDQQGALMGQGCVHPGEMKATYGTGCFMLLNTGAGAAGLPPRASWPPWRRGWRGGRPMPWRARSSSPARRSSGWRRGWASWADPRRPSGWPPRRGLTMAWCWCPRSRGLARPGGTRRRGARSSA